jgi:hypothetical protein
LHFAKTFVWSHKSEKLIANKGGAVKHCRKPRLHFSRAFGGKIAKTNIKNLFLLAHTSHESWHSKQTAKKIYTIWGIPATCVARMTLKTGEPFLFLRLAARERKTADK